MNTNDPKVSEQGDGSLARDTVMVESVFPDTKITIANERAYLEELLDLLRDKQMDLDASVISRTKAADHLKQLQAQYQQTYISLSKKMETPDIVSSGDEYVDVDPSHTHLLGIRQIVEAQTSSSRDHSGLELENTINEICIWDLLERDADSWHSDANSALQEIQASIETLILTINDHNRHIRYSEKLPNELWQEIFLLAGDFHTRISCLSTITWASIRRSCLFAVPISGVCRLWRHLAHSTPQLWRNMCLEQWISIEAARISFFHVELAKGKITNLIMWPTNNETHLSWRSHWPDLRIVCIYCIVDEGRQIPASLQLSSLPGPRRLVLFSNPTNIHNSRVLIPFHFGSGLIQLEEINVEGSGRECRPFNSTEIIHWSHTHIGFETGPVRVGSTMHYNFPNVRVAIIDLPFNIQPSTLFKGTLIHLHTIITSLRTLVRGFGTNVKIPCLRRIEITSPNVSSMEEWDTFLASNMDGVKITELRVGNIPRVDSLHIFEFIQRLRGVKKLELAGSVVEPMVLRWVESMVVHSPGSVVFPKLDNLILDIEVRDDKLEEKLLASREAIQNAAVNLPPLAVRWSSLFDLYERSENT